MFVFFLEDLIEVDGYLGFSYFVFVHEDASKDHLVQDGPVAWQLLFLVSLCLHCHFVWVFKLMVLRLLVQIRLSILKNLTNFISAGNFWLVIRWHQTVLDKVSEGADDAGSQNNQAQDRCHYHWLIAIFAIRLKEKIAFNLYDKTKGECSSDEGGVGTKG